MLTEWFTRQGARHPWRWATAVFLSQSLLNEMSENNGRDVLYGGKGEDTLYGYGAADRLEGGPDIDYLDGGPGPDKMLGDAGNDTFVTGTGPDGADVIRGGAGSGDRLGYEQRPAKVTIDQNGKADDGQAGEMSPMRATEEQRCQTVMRVDEAADWTLRSEDLLDALEPILVE